MSRRRAATAAPALELQQLLYTWASPNLDGANGFGVVATSAGWDLPELLSSSAATFGFLPQGSTTQLRQGVEAPSCLAYLRAGEGCLVLRKTALPLGQGMNRPGNYVVHVLHDPAGRLTAGQALALWDAELPARALPADVTVPTTDLPAALLQPADLPRVAAPDGVDLDLPDAEREALVEAALVALRTGERLFLTAPTSDAGAALLAAVLEPLPAPMASTLSFSTFEADPVQAESVLTVLHPQFLARPVPASAHAFDLRQPERARLPAGTASERALARTLVGLARDGRLPPDLDAIATFSELERTVRAVEIGRKKPSTLTAADIEVLVAADPRWLHTAGNRGLLVNRFSGEPARLQAVVADLPAATAELLEDDVAARLVEARVSGDKPAADALTGMLRILDSPDVHQDRATVDALLQRLRDDRKVGVEALVECWPAVAAVQRERPAGELEEIVAAADAAGVTVARLGWGPLAAAVVRRYLADPSEARREMVGPLLGENLEHLPQVVDEVLDAGAELEAVEEALIVGLGALDGVDVLLRSGAVPQGAVLYDVLPALEDDERVAVLQARWPEVAEQAGLPASVHRLLAPTRPARVDGADVLPGQAGRAGLLRRRKPR